MNYSFGDKCVNFCSLTFIILAIIIILRGIVWGIISIYNINPEYVTHLISLSGEYLYIASGIYFFVILLLCLIGIATHDENKNKDDDEDED